jgi:hypothetical protein
MRPEEICVVVAYNDYYEDMAAITVEKNIQYYCKLHGYSLHVDKRSTDRYAAWNKIIACIDVLPKYKWLFFIDLDCLFMNQTIRLEDLIDDRYSFMVPSHFLPAVDNPLHVDWKTDNIITSQFFVQNTKAGMDILQDIWAANDIEDITKFDYEGRQTRVTIQKPEFAPHVKIIEEKLVNRFWWTADPFVAMRNIGINNNAWEPGDFIVHVTGYKKEQRINILEGLNHFSGGIVAGYTRIPEQIIFTPLYDLKDISFQIYYPGALFVINYTFPDLTYKLEYILYAEGLDDKPLIVKAFDGTKLISTKYIPVC